MPYEAARLVSTNHLIDPVINLCIPGSAHCSLARSPVREGGEKSVPLPPGCCWGERIYEFWWWWPSPLAVEASIVVAIGTVTEKQRGFSSLKPDGDPRAKRPTGRTEEACSARVVSGVFRGGDAATGIGGDEGPAAGAWVPIRGGNEVRMRLIGEAMRIGGARVCVLMARCARRAGRSSGRVRKSMGDEMR